MLVLITELGGRARATLSSETRKRMWEKANEPEPSQRCRGLREKGEAGSDPFF